MIAASVSKRKRRQDESIFDRFIFGGEFIVFCLIRFNIDKS